MAEPALSTIPAPMHGDPRRTHGGLSADDRRFERIALAIYSVLIALLAAMHEPWRDETQTWRLALDSHGMRDLAWNARYEGSPLLFHVMLQALGLLSRSWWAAVALHVVIACTAAWVVLRFAPFSRFEKALVLAGYFPAYEYAVIVRQYGLGMLLLFAACAAWTRTPRRPVLTVVLLILLANTSALGMLLALAAGAAIVLEWVWPDDGPPRIGRRELAIGAAAVLLAVVAAWLVVKQVKPPADAAFKGDGAAERRTAMLWHVATGLLVPFRAMVPIAKIGEGTVQWNRWLFEPYSRTLLMPDLLVTTGIMLVGCAISLRRRSSLFFFLCGTLGLVAFFELFVEGGSRHHGHVALVWIVAAWLSRSGPATEWPLAVRGLADRVRRSAPRLFAISLVPMVLACIEFGISDAALPFSDARGTTNFLRDHGLATLPIIGLSRADAQAVSALLDRPMVYAAENGRTSTFISWGAAKVEPPRDSMVLAVTARVLENACRVVLLAVQPMVPPRALASRARLVYETSYRPMSKDRYRVWTLDAPESPRCPTTLPPLPTVPMSMQPSAPPRP